MSASSPEDMDRIIDTALGGTSGASEGTPQSDPPPAPAPAPTATSVAPAPAPTTPVAEATDTESIVAEAVEEDHEAEVEDRKTFRKWMLLYWFAIVPAQLIVYGLLAISGFAFLKAIKSKVVDAPLGLAQGLLLSLVLYITLSWEIVNEKKIGTLVFLGFPLFDVAGFVPRPAIISKVVTFKRGTIGLEIPAEPEDIYREEGIVPKGKRPPIRVTFSEDATPGIKDPLRRRLTEEVVPFIRFRILSPTVFVKEIGDLEEARRQLEDAVVGYLTTELGKITIAELLKNKQKYDRELERIVIAKTRRWGIRIVSAQIKMVNLSKKLNVAMQAGAEAVGQNIGKLLNAENEKQTRTLIGEGTGAAEASIITQRGMAMKAVADMLKVGGRDVLASETARGTLGGANKTVIVGGSGGIRDAAGLMELLPGNNPATPAPLPDIPVSDGASKK